VSPVEPPTERLVEESDRIALAQFRCALDRWYEQEVESHINREAFDRYLWRREHTGYRLLLFENEHDGLVGVAASEVGELGSGGQSLSNTYVAFIAVNLNCRRRHVAFHGEPRVGEYVLDRVIADANGARPSDELIYAAIAKENHASLALFRSRGFNKEMAHTDDRYVYALGSLA
jgi:hypothetical protein